LKLENNRFNVQCCRSSQQHWPLLMFEITAMHIEHQAVLYTIVVHYTVGHTNGTPFIIAITMFTAVRLSHGSISYRQLKLGSCNLHHTVAPWLVSWCLTSPRNSKGNTGSGKRERYEEYAIFSQ